MRQHRSVSPLGSTALFLAAAALALPLSAQVLRCTDPATGRVTYTDASCPRGAAAHEVEARKSAAELALQEEQARQALARKQERRQREAAEREAQHARDDLRPLAGSAPPASPAESAACRQAHQELLQLQARADPNLYDDALLLDQAQRRRELACLSPAELARLEAQRPRPAPAAAASPVIVIPGHPQRPPLRPRPPPPRPEISHCNVFRCYDRQGNVYPR